VQLNNTVTESIALAFSRIWSNLYVLPIANE